MGLDALEGRLGAAALHVRRGDKAYDQYQVDQTF